MQKQQLSGSTILNLDKSLLYIPYTDEIKELFAINLINESLKIAEANKFMR